MRALALNVRLGVGIGTTEHKSFEWKGEGFQLGDLIFLAKMNAWKYV